MTERIQEIVNEYPDVLNKQINDSLGFSKKQSLEWLSPKAEDDHLEYRDQAFLDLLGIKLSQTKLIRNIFKESELDQNSVVKGYLTTASDGKRYKIVSQYLDFAEFQARGRKPL